MRLMLTLLAGLGLPLAAHAQDGFDAHGFNLAAFDGDVRDPLYTLRPGRMTEGDYFFGGLLEYAKAPLVLISPDGSGGTTRDIIVDDVLALNLSAGISPVNRVRIDLALPLYLNSTDTNGDPQGLDIGDMRLSAMIGLLQPAEDGGGFGLGLGSYLDVPSGNEAKFLGYENFAGGVRAAATYEFTRLTLTGDLGMEFRPTIALDNLTGPERLVMGAGVSYLLQDNVALNLEAHALPPLSAVEQAGAEGTDLPAEALLSMRGRNKRNFHWTLGGAGALGRRWRCGVAPLRGRWLRPHRGPDAAGPGR